MKMKANNFVFLCRPSSKKKGWKGTRQAYLSIAIINNYEIKHNEIIILKGPVAVSLIS